VSAVLGSLGVYPPLFWKRMRKVLLVNEFGI
jgi:hypothetical protein